MPGLQPADIFVGEMVATWHRT